MRAPRSRIKVFREGQDGFTLPEVMITIVLLGIVLSIVTSSWFNIVESRRVESATNQLVSDLRLAQNSASNRLTNFRIVVPATAPTTSERYDYGPQGGTLTTRTMPDGVGASSTYQVIEFRPDGRINVYATPGDAMPQACSPPTIRVGANDGEPRHSVIVDCETGSSTIEYNTHEEDSGGDEDSDDGSGGGGCVLPVESPIPIPPLVC